MNHNNSNVRKKTQKIDCFEYPRIGHRTVCFQDYLLIFGGISQGGWFSTTILMINLKNLEVKLLPTSNYLPLQGFSLFKNSQKLYLWGGITPSHASNELWNFDGLTFQKCSQIGIIPEPRGYHTSAFIFQRYLLIYGGWNTQQIFNTWHIFDFEQSLWKNVQCATKLPPSQDLKMVWQHGRGFLWSSIFSETNKYEISFHIYEIKFINLKKFNLKIEEIFWTDQSPSPRINSEILLCGTKLFLFGGETFQKQQYAFLDDVWVYDIELLQWQNIKVKLNSKTKFQVNNINSKIILTGGVQNRTKLSQNIEIISLRSLKSIETGNCCNCNRLFIYSSPNNPLQKLTFLKNILNSAQKIPLVLSASFFRKVCDFLQSNLKKSISLLLDSLIEIQAQEIHLNYRQITKDQRYYKNDENFIELSALNTKLNKLKFYQIMNFFVSLEQYSKKWKYSAINFKLGAYSLGKSILFVSRTSQKGIFVGFMSCIPINSLDNQETPQNFFYFINKDKDVSSYNDRIIINQNVSNFIEESQYLSIPANLLKIYIFHPHPQCINNLIPFDPKQNQNSTSKQLLNLEELLNTYLLNIKKNSFNIFINGMKMDIKSLNQNLKENLLDESIQEINFNNKLKEIQELRAYRRLKFSAEYYNGFFVYSQNKFVMKLQFSNFQEYFGVISLNADVKTGILKDRIVSKEIESVIVNSIKDKLEDILENNKQNDQMRKFTENADNTF